MRFNIILFFFFSIITFVACATIYPLPSFEKRVYHPCADDEVEDPVGKLCFSRCAKRSFFKGYNQILPYP